MGTRNLTVVIKDGNVRVAQYCQWDGYPAGQGVAILEFLRDKYDPVTFEANLAKTVPMTSDDISRLWEEEGAVDGMANMEVSQRFESKYPSLHRNMGGDILLHIQNKAGVPLYLDYDYGYSSLWCEYAYVVDLDRSVFEVYKGFNQTPTVPTDRWYKPEPDDSGYYGVVKVREYRFMELPSDEDFVNEVEHIIALADAKERFNEAMEKLLKVEDDYSNTVRTILNYVRVNEHDVIETLIDE
jgi:hypothetical protein